MLFNSIDFAVFLPIVFLLYWLVFSKSLKKQNLFLILASYVFYGWWDWRFLLLILISTLVDFYVGKKLGQETAPKKRKLLLWVSVLTNLGMLGFFKYFNFFIENFTSAFTFFGASFQPNTLNIILPVGISFYTFQTLSYTIDVYRKKLTPTNDGVAFSAFVCFFPQLVAGPIERASNLLPQFYKNRTFNYNNAVDGMRQILWGLIKKMVIADNCAVYANLFFNNSGDYSGSTLLLGALFFTFQIYGDFSGYSDIAIGTSRLFGFDLHKNFAFPYFSRDFAEFWRRWHISLSTWFRDYVYIPLGGSHGGKWMKIRNTFIIFLVSGFWHGANWTFIIWGLLNAVYFLPLLLTNKNRINLDIVAQGSNLPTIKDFLKIALTFTLTVFAWIFFRAESGVVALQIVSEIFSESLFIIPSFEGKRLAVVTAILIVLFMIAEWFGREKAYASADWGLHLKRPLRWVIYAIQLFIIFQFMETDKSPFIYFQF
ncbi:MBOAT family O-acyltransferase [Flavobacterium orientale]|uniref:O-acyltransferase n=1 Tax=Flavobacterium orientale TaxID=1756020 RepID=A0A916XYZ8_9FLAO|nr:MBOAT family protein [Flavobacterium orientale]GGD22057.1 O-acyltransferase [Flavobacterium orientale]